VLYFTAMATRTVSAVILVCALVSAKGNDFEVRYNGGSIETKVSPHDWGNELTITPETITLDIHDKERTHFQIPSKSVTSLSYGQEAHRRVGTMIALAVLVAPVALFGLLHKTRLHFIGIQYKLPDGKSGGILLQGDKSNYRALLVALQGVTGAPVSVSEKEREYVPVSVTANLTKSDAQGNATPAGSGAAEPKSVSGQVGTVALVSAPDSADVFVDGQFYGNSPATLKLKPGKHIITIKLNGFKEWSRELMAEAGSDVHLSATLEK
jgi:hypothetical protein